MKLFVDFSSIYKFVFSIWYFVGIISRTTIGSNMGFDIGGFDDVVDVAAAVILLLMLLLFQNYTLKEILILIVVGVVVLVSGINSGNYLLIPTFLFIAAARYVDFNDIIMLAYRLLIIGFIIVIICYALGIATDYELFRGDHIRYSLGFSHPNILGLRVLQLVMYRFYLRGDNFGVRDFIIGIIATLFVYYIPNSQTAVICIGAYVIAMFVRKIKVDKYGEGVVFGRVLIVLTLLFNILSIVFSIIIEKSDNLRMILNVVFSWRFHYSNVIYNMYGINLFGNKLSISGAGELIKDSNVGRLYLDNAYMGMILWYGIVMYLIFNIAYLLLMNYSYSRGNMMLFIALFIFSLYGVMELGMYIIAQNTFLIAFSYLIFDEKMGADIDG